MSQLAASDLVHEDSRRLVVDETELLQDELDAERELRRKGKLRDFDEDEEEQQDPQDETLLQPPRPVPSRHESYEYNSSDTKQVKRDKRRKYWQNAAVNVLFIASWYFFSSLISVYNKWMFSPEHYNFGYPLFVTTFHMIVQFSLSGLVLSLVPRFRPKHRPQTGEYLSKAAPCGAATGLDIGLSNLSLKTITLSFYTMCKSSSLGFVLIFAFLFHLEKPTWRLVGIISIITVGLVLMVSGETKFHLVGMMEVLTASALGGLRWALTQILLDKETMGLNNPFATLFWLAPIMAATLATCSLLFEGPRAIFSSDEFWGSMAATLKTSAVILFPGVLAFFMTVSEFALIQRTSVVTLSVAGIFKEVSTIFVSTTIFHDELTPINISGLCVTLVGIALYNYLKYAEATSTRSGSSPELDKGVRFASLPGHEESSPKLGMYNIGEESALYPSSVPGGGYDVPDETTILGDDSDSDDEDRERIHPVHKQVDEREMGEAELDKAIHDDPKMQKLDREEVLFDQELERKL